MNDYGTAATAGPPASTNGYYAGAGGKPGRTAEPAPPYVAAAAAATLAPGQTSIPATTLASAPAPARAPILVPTLAATAAAAPVAPPLAHAVALYPFNPTDAGDLAVAPDDKITVTEYLNAEWWQGRNERTGQIGIFPSSYVRTMEGPLLPLPPPPLPEQQVQKQPATSYGNIPLEMSQNGAAAAAAPPSLQQAGKQPSQVHESAKKFGKKLGNAAIFGAGATIGSDIVHSIF